MDLKDELDRARAQTDGLFRLIAHDTLHERPIPDRHRLIFYLGHLEAFDWNQLARGVLDEPSFNPAFDRLFEAGIDPPVGQAPQDDPADWPSADEVLAYNTRVRQRLDTLWYRCPAERQQVAIEHRWMHAETLCYLLQQLDHGLKRRPSPLVNGSALAPGAGFIDIPAGVAHLGQPNGSFGWDNEFQAHAVSVPPLSVAKHKVTNADYQRFVADGGPVPPFWRKRDGDWWLHRMFDEVPLPAYAPVYATHGQASAYAEWADGALPTEAEWHRAAYGDDARAYPWGDSAPNARHGNLDFAGWDAVAVTAHPAGDSVFRVSQLMGNGWEWTSTPFAGFDGFEARPYYPGYSADFFDGDHYVIKGASPRTARRLLRRSFRNWFRAEYPYVYSTFRLVRR
jgi:formylglycine-generating enzyme required for sulfatase activity